MDAEARAKDIYNSGVVRQSDIAKQLNKEGYKTKTGRMVTQQWVSGALTDAKPAKIDDETMGMLKTVIHRLGILRLREIISD